MAKSGKLKERLLLGSGKESKNTVPVNPQNMFFHTLVLGQSGSGKSYFLARVVEEILLRTKARVIAIDPNGDFETFFAPRELGFWRDSEFGARLNSLNAASQQAEITKYDSKEAFEAKWKDTLFQQVRIGQESRAPLSENSFAAPLRLHWKNLHPTIQDFLLGVNPSIDPKVFQGIATCHHVVDESRGRFPHKANLADLEDIALLFETKKLVPSLNKHADAMTLASEDWNRVRMFFRKVRKGYGNILYPAPLKDWVGTIPSDLSNYVNRGFFNSSSGKSGWNFLSIGLAGALPAHSLLSALVTLQKLWDLSVFAWREERNKTLEAVKASMAPQSRVEADTEIDLETLSTLDDSDYTEADRAISADAEEFASEQQGTATAGTPRRPTFVFIDEAHNFIPEVAESELQRKVSDLIFTIAAEGRKYGIFLVISTQRPQKLRKGIVAECENIAVLKIQSKMERRMLAESSPIPEEILAKAGDLGQGFALLSGRWVGDITTVQFAPARTVLGGANIKDADWL